MKKYVLLLAGTALMCSCLKREPINIPTEEEKDSFTFHCEVDASVSLEKPLISICLVKGQTEKPYEMTVRMDGETLRDASRSIYFATTPIIRESLPESYPGKHEIIVKLSYGDIAVSDTLSYTEPIRHPDFDINIRNDNNSGTTYLTVDSNPYAISMTIKDSLVVKGTCTHTVCVTEGYTRKETKEKSICSINTLYEITPSSGGRTNLINWRATEQEMCSFSEVNKDWEMTWSNASEGCWEYREVFAGLSYYSVTSTTHHITATIKAFPGVTANIHSEIPSCIFNGHDLSTGVFQIPL